jgi:hypothetical protein
MNQKTFNTLISIFNSQVQAIGSVLTSESQAILPWPPRDFLSSKDPSMPSLDWNSKSNIDRIRSCIESFKLPEMNMTDESSGEIKETTEHLLSRKLEKIKSVRALYENYVTQCKYSIKSSSSASTLLSTIWNRLAPFERSFLGRNFSSASSSLIGSGDSKSSFPFSKIFLSLASSAIESMEANMSDLSGGKSSPWYDARQVETIVETFRNTAQQLVYDWEKDIIQCWQSKKDQPVLDITEVSQPMLTFYTSVNISAQDGDTPPPSTLQNQQVMESPLSTSSYITPSKGKGRANYTNGVENLSNSSRISTPQINNLNIAPSPSSIKSVDDSDSAYARLKRRLSDAINNSKREMEVSKRRLGKQ